MEIRSTEKSDEPILVFKGVSLTTRRETTAMLASKVELVPTEAVYFFEA